MVNYIDWLKGIKITHLVSMIGTPEYKLPKYVDNLIKPYIPNPYLLKSTGDFIERMKQFPCNHLYCTVSFHVVPLFTNFHFQKLLSL